VRVKAGFAAGGVALLNQMGLHKSQRRAREAGSSGCRSVAENLLTAVGRA
jgi:hypothetical protein